MQKLLLLEIDEKDKRGVECQIRNAKFQYRKYLEDIDVRYLPGGMQKKLPELSNLAFIEKGQNVILAQVKHM